MLTSTMIQNIHYISNYLALKQILDYLVHLQYITFNYRETLRISNLRFDNIQFVKMYTNI